MQLSQKEMSYLQDAKKQEQLCVAKYQTYSQQAQDPQLAQLLQTIAGQEQQHLQTIQQMLQGQVPASSASSSGSSSNQQQSGMQGGSMMQSNNTQTSGMTQASGMQRQQQSTSAGNSNQNTQMVNASGHLTDRQICDDQLATEKAVSDLYEHAAFEFTDHQLRQALDHIQQEEHHHGFMLWQYMNQHGMYQAQ